MLPLCWDTINQILKCLHEDQALESKVGGLKGRRRNCLLLVCVREELLSALRACFLSSNKLGSAVPSDFPEILVQVSF